MNPSNLNRFGRRSTRGHVRKTKRTLPTWLVLVFGLIGLLAFFVLVRAILPNDNNSTQTNYHNRTWLSNDWTTTAPQRAQVEALVNRLKANDIDRVYVEAGSWRGDFTYRAYEYSDEFRAMMHEIAPEMDVLVWIWANEDIYTRAASRQSAQSFASQAVGQWDYDGVHLRGVDVTTDSTNYVELLRALATVTESNDAILSITVPPDRRPADPAIPVGSGNLSYSWSPSYKQQVSLLVDEMVIMAHSSGLSDADDYEVWMAYQIETYAKDVMRVNDTVDLIIALPAFEAADLHDPDVENIETSTRAAQKGIDQAGNARTLIKGTGMYVYQNATNHDWDVFKDAWAK